MNENKISDRLQDGKVSENGTDIGSGLERKFQSFSLDASGYLGVGEDEIAMLNGKRSQTEFDLQRHSALNRRRRFIECKDRRSEREESISARRLLRIADEGVRISGDSSKSESRDEDVKETYHSIAMRFETERVFSMNYPRKLSTIREDSSEEQECED